MHLQALELRNHSILQGCSHKKKKQTKHQNNTNKKNTSQAKNILAEPTKQK